MAMTKEERAAYIRKWYQDNKEVVKAKSRAYYAANKETQNAKKREYYHSNKERENARCLEYKNNNKQKLRLYYKRYNEDNKESRTEAWARRRALRRKQVPVHLRDCPHEKQRLVQIYKLRNIISEATGVQHHVDHMWPLSDGGPHWSGNLQVIPAAENMSKHASVCEETKATIIKSLYTFESERSI